MTDSRENPVHKDGASVLSSDLCSDDITPVVLKLKAACECEGFSISSINLFERNMKDCCTSLDDCSLDKKILVLTLLNSDSFNEKLDVLCHRACPQEFTSRDYFAYDKSDFEGQCDKSKCVFKFLIKLLSGLDFHDKKLISYSDETSNAVFDGCTNNQENPVSLVAQKLSSHLPDFMFLVAGNASHPIWSSSSCQELSLQVVHLLLRLYECETISDLLEVKIRAVKTKVSLKPLDKTLLSYLFHEFELPLSKERWEKNPFLCEVFSWLARQLSPSQSSLCLMQVLAVALNFLHNFDSKYKLKGLHLFSHLIDNVSNEELRWYNRADVIYEALKSHIYSKEDLVLDTVIDCMFSVLKILEKQGDAMNRHHFVLATLLTQAELENVLSLRRIYILRLSQFVPHCGAICIGHLGDILKVVECYLEVEDGPKELGRLSALDVLENVLRVAWPRIPFHAETVLKFLLKFIININSPSFVKPGGPGSVAKRKLEEKTAQCLDLLGRANPDVYSCLEALRESDHQGYLNSFLETLSVLHNAV